LQPVSIKEAGIMIAAARVSRRKKPLINRLFSYANGPADAAKALVKPGMTEKKDRRRIACPLKTL
jgi:hypothetical protein